MTQTTQTTRIDDLIQQHCPNGVVLRPLGELVKIRNGKDHKPLGDGPFPAYGTGGILRYVDASAYSGPSVLIPRKGSLDKLYYVEEPFWTVDTIFYTVIGPELAPRFLYHYLHKLKLAELNQAGGVPSLTQSVLNRIRIPVPPLVVQEEIVRILDTFTQLEAELEAELEARRQQYEHYRAQLFTNASDSEQRLLGELAEFKYGFTAKAAADGAFRFLRITDIEPNGRLSETGAKYVDIDESAENFVVERDDLLMARTGATYGKTMIFESEEPSVYASFLIRIRFKKPNILPRYYWHFAQSHLYWSQADALVSSGSQPQFNANALKQVRLPVPPLAEQERIIALLDQFDALVNGLGVGLPAEIRARRQQYEFYRDRLLSFEELRS